MAELKYAHLIVTKPKPDVKMPEYRRKSAEAPPDMRTGLIYLDNEVVKGAYYVECVWYWKGSKTYKVDAHTHDFDEVIGFFGTDPKAPYELNGEIELWLGDEKYLLTKSCLVFVPKGLKHCPLLIRRVDIPIFHFTAGPSGDYK